MNTEMQDNTTHPKSFDIDKGDLSQNNQYLNSYDNFYQPNKN